LPRGLYEKKENLVGKRKKMKKLRRVIIGNDMRPSDQVLKGPISKDYPKTRPSRRDGEGGETKFRDLGLL